MIDGKCKEACLIHIEKNHGIQARNLVTIELAGGGVIGIWGFLLEFFDSVGIIISIDFTLVTVIFDRSSENNNDWKEVYVGEYNLRQQAQTEATTKANEIFNQAHENKSKGI